MLRDALDDGLTEVDPFRNLSWPRIAFEGPAPHSAAERDAILKYLREKTVFRVGRGSGRYGYRVHYDYFAAVLLLAYTGMRPSEAIGLRMKDVDLKRMLITVRGAAVLGRRKAPKTTSSERLVAIDGDTAFVLEPLIKLHTTETESLFHAPEGGFMDQEKLNRVFCDAQRALKITPIRGVYSTKDTFCSTYISNGGRWSWLSEQTGVAIQTLKRHYAKYERTLEDDAAELARLRPRAPKEDETSGENGGELSHDLSHVEAAGETNTRSANDKSNGAEGIRTLDPHVANVAALPWGPPAHASLVIGKQVEAIPERIPKLVIDPIELKSLRLDKPMRSEKLLLIAPFP
jgi:hypothetical protein